MIRARWRARPPAYSRPVWALLIILDLLPWPWGEHILAFLFLVVAFARPRQRRKALAWAAAQRPCTRWRLAAAVSAFPGRWVARWRLIGLRTPDEFLQHVTVDGDDHLRAARGGAILLAFHLGPPHGDVALTLRGHRLRHLGWYDTPGWWSDAWRPVMTGSPVSSLAGDSARWTAVLYSARRTLLEGGHVFITADGAGGQDLFRIALPGAELVLRGGWSALRRLTGAPVLPLLSRLEGRRQIVTVHPPLPADETESRAVITSLVTDYVRRFPEQSAVLVHGLRP